MAQNFQDVSFFVRMCGILAPVASVLVCMSPIPTIQRIVRDRQVGSLPLLPYSTMVINATLWFSYGLLKRNASIWSCNGIGILLGIYYMVNFIQFAPSSSSTLPGSVQDHLLVVGGALFFIVLVIVLLEDPSWIIGKVGMVIGVLLFASPLAALRVVMATKSARSIPLPFTIASIFNCYVWTVFGVWQVHDLNIYLPNFLGLLFSLTQLGLKMQFDDDVMKEFGRADDSIPLTMSQQ